MDVKVCSDAKLDLSKSCLLNEIPNLSLNKTVTVNGVGIFDDDGKILPIISEYLSYQSKHQIISYKSAVTYGRNLSYFLNYIRSRPDYDDNESDEVFITIPKYVIQEYLTFLIREDHKSSSTVRSRDETIHAFIQYLCSPTEDRDKLRQDNPYSDGLLSKPPKRTPISSCTLDDLFILIEFTDSERERALLQFLYDSGLRRSELPRVTLQDFKDTSNFSSEKFISCDTDQPIHADYVPLKVKGSKGRGNQIKPRWTLLSLA